MTPERFRQIEQVFDTVADAPPAERSALLDRLCGDDAALRAEVKSLLSASGGAPAHIEGAIRREAGHTRTPAEVRAPAPWADTAEGLVPGAVIAGRYRLDRRLGDGGMSVVWAATHVGTGEGVALKLIKQPGATPIQHARLVREARAARAVRHPNVCEVHDVLQLGDGSPVLVMEHLVGEPLSSCLRREGKLSIEDVAAIFVPLVSAVRAAHALGIVHRDLKPDNIFLVGGPPPVVKVLDFGIVKLTASEGAAAATAALTETGTLVGTPHYMSPEQAFGEKDVDARADVWALGIIAYQCLSGVLPTSADNLGQIFKNIVLRPIPPLAGAAPDVPSDVAGLVDRMLSRTRNDRLSDLGEVTRVLARYAGGPRAHAGGAPPGGPEERRDTEVRAPGSPFDTDVSATERDAASRPTVEIGPEPPSVEE